MAKDLKEALVNPEAKLGGAEKPYMDLGDHLEYIESLLEQGAEGAGGKSVPPTLNLIDFETEGVRTTITQEEKDNLEKGLYNQVLYPDGTPFGYFMPSKMLGDKLLDINMFVQFYPDMNTGSITSLSLYSFSIGGKDTSGNYPITTEKQGDIPVGSSGGNIWYNLNTTSGTITQNQYDEIKSLIDSNSLAGIKHTTIGIYFPLVNSENNGTFTFGHYGLGSESTGSNTKYSMDKMEMIIKSDLSVSFSLKDVYVPVLTQNLSSQSIPSIKTDGYQENLTIGDGLTIENGALKATSGGSGGEILELNEADSNTVQFMDTNKEITLTGVYDLNKTYKGFKITTSDMEETFYFDAMMVVPGMNFKAYNALLFEISGNEIIYSSYEIGITNNTISIIYKNESLPLTGGGSNVTITFED